MDRAKRNVTLYPMTGLRSYLRTFALLVAAFGLFANGAQAHVQVRSPDSIDVPMCGNGLGHVMHIGIGDPQPVDTGSETCCGDCLVIAAVLPPEPVLPGRSVPSQLIVSQAPTSIVSPRSPLWPGAPPVGPPASFKA